MARVTREFMPDAGDAGAAEPSIVVGVGASAGGVEAASTLVAGLPADFPGAIVVAIHTASTRPSALARILARAGHLPAIAPMEPAPLLAGRIYVSPPGRHLLVAPGQVVPSGGPRENGHRPAVDPMFRTMADAYAERAVGVVLSGARDDGTAGLHCIKQRGGLAFVQDPAECMFDGMPASAVAHVDVDGVLPVADLAQTIARLGGTSPVHPPTPNRMAITGNGPESEDAATRFTCPDCGGVLHAHHEGAVDQYRCSVGHQYSPDSLDGEHARMTEFALWAATRALDDRAALLEDMRRRAERHGHNFNARMFAERSAAAKRHSDTLRKLAEQVATDQPSVGDVEAS